MPLVGMKAWNRKTSLQLRMGMEKRADTNVTDLIAGYKRIDCMYQLTGNDQEK
jgi:hypothetical protein